MKLSSAPPDTRRLVAQARQQALAARRDFDGTGAVEAAERAAKDLTILIRMHSVFKIVRRIEWYREEIARLRR
jgi:hypothetical protein